MGTFIMANQAEPLLPPPSYEQVAGLPPGVRAIFDDASGMNYYVLPDGSVTWDMPVMDEEQAAETLAPPPPKPTGPPYIYPAPYAQPPGHISAAPQSHGYPGAQGYPAGGQPQAEPPGSHRIIGVLTTTDPAHDDPRCAQVGAVAAIFCPIAGCCPLFLNNDAPIGSRSRAWALRAAL